jgi:flagellar protein FlgJ
VDVVVHLHGYSASGARMKIQDKAAVSGLDLGSPGGGRTLRPMLGLVPRGSYFGGQSGAGYNFPELVQPGAISRLVASGLELLRAQTGVQATVGRLILTGHSGGGAPLDAILRHTDADEVHLFDGSYGDMAHLVAWARRRIARGSATSALRVLFRPGSGTAKHALAIAAAICPTISASADAAGLHRRFRVEATTVEHNRIPTTYGRLLLVDAGADLPGAVRQGCAHAGGARSGPATTPATTKTPDRAAGIVKVTPYAKDGTHALPGAVALAQQWRRLTGRDAGTFNARNTSFGTRSLHSEGRAIDCHGHVSKPNEASQADAYIRWLMANAVELQVSTIIWNRRIWSWPRRAQGWRSYMTKPNHNPHTDHFHVDLSWEGALHPSPLFAGGVPGLAGGAAIAPSAPGTPPTAPKRRVAVPPAPSRPPSAGPAPQAGAKRSPAEFVRMFGPFAKASEARTGVPGLVTLGQAAAESGWGARAAGNNFFGIKAKAGDAPGTRQLWVTREVLSRPDVRSFPEVISVKPRPDGRYDYMVRDWFRVFPSPELAFVGHGEFLRRNKRYAKAFAFRNDPYRFMAEVAKAGFATDPRYTQLVHSVMRLLERSGWR